MDSVTVWQNVWCFWQGNTLNCVPQGMNRPILQGTGRALRWVGCSVVTWHGAGSVLCCERVPRVILLDVSCWKIFLVIVHSTSVLKNKSPTYCRLREKRGVCIWHTE